MDMPHRIAKAISENENLKISPNFVNTSIKRLGLEKEFISRNAKIFPQIKALDNIIKKNSNTIKNKGINATQKLNFLIKEYHRAKGGVNNSSLARMLGLPAKDIALIDNLSKIGTSLGVKVAGDHTDIKALMKNYPNYKKTFYEFNLYLMN